MDLQVKTKKNVKNSLKKYKNPPGIRGKYQVIKSQTFDP